ncbi:MAG: biotin--[acetyl-CoA-carboxylase] ligase [Wenzhouxiangellaceae bacterium]|nr:biotin--[acetyl-CoA-carboxylase] ligase [Wenzhouxiangellaceae bacterium]
MGPLDGDRIRAAGVPAGVEVSVLPSVTSTNDLLRERFAHRKAVLAEEQRAGRGRRGRRWDSPPGAGLWLSFGYAFSVNATRLAGLAPALGTAMAEQLPGGGVAVKWPNDLVCDGAKLGGILIELVGGATSPCRAVIGLGLNLVLPGDCRQGPDDRWPRTDLVGALGLSSATSLDRNELAAGLLSALDAACALFDREGLLPFRARHARRDALAGQMLSAETAPGNRIRGRADGLADNGGLRLIDASGQVHVLNAGDVHVERI